MFGNLSTPSLTNDSGLKRRKFDLSISLLNNVYHARHDLYLQV